mgnify:CR=1 FL=1
MGDEGRRSGRERAAKKNRDAEEPESEALRKVDAVALKLAHIIGQTEAIVTQNIRDFQPPLKLGMTIATPGEIVRRLNA